MSKRGRERTLTDAEIGLIKTMLAKGMKNDEVHFHFNRPDRLISSGRVSQIKAGKYGAAVAPATLAEMNAFLTQWRMQRLGGPAEPHIEPTHAEAIASLFVEIGGAWVLSGDETDQAECKQNFKLTPENRFADCIKTIAGLANNKGGYIIFGISGTTHAVEGMDGDTFEETDPAEINRCLAGALDPVPKVTKLTVSIGEKKVGVLRVDPHQHPPVMLLKNIPPAIKEGAIYYRYVGETRLIKPGELRQLIGLREQRAVADFARRMGQVATGAAATLDLDTGQVLGRAGSFVIDKDLLPNLQFIREGDFTHVIGAPALRLIGDVEPVSEVEKERVRVIRNAVTPDAVIRNFLIGERVADPMQYVHAQAHFQRGWLPVWYYVRQTEREVDAIVDDLSKQVATHPASRDGVVRRLCGADTALKVHPGKAAAMRAELLEGETADPSTVPQIVVFANAVMGLPSETPEPDRLRSILLTCLDRLGTSEGGKAARSAVYRAACRVDELLWGPA